MAIDADKLALEVLQLRGLGSGGDALSAVALAINKAIVDLNNFAGQSLDELSTTAETFGDIDISTSYGNPLRQLIDYHLERSPFWKREDRLVSDAERLNALGDARRIKGVTWSGPNLGYDSAS